MLWIDEKFCRFPGYLHGVVAISMLVEVAGTIFWHVNRIAGGDVSPRQLLNRVLEGYQTMFLDISEKLACSRFGISGSLRVGKVLC